MMFHNEGITGRAVPIARLAEVVSQAIDEMAGNYYGDRTGACDRCNGLLGLAAERLGHEVAMCYGTVEGLWHVWVDIDGVLVDVAGTQFGKPVVHVASHGDTTYLEEERRAVSDMLSEMYEEDMAIVEHVIAILTRNT